MERNIHVSSLQALHCNAEGINSQKFRPFMKQVKVNIMLTTKDAATSSTYERMHFGIIRVVHETLYGLFVNPDRILTQAGLKPGQQVLEVGCGPGFFTIPAAKIVGDAGRVHALDINPAAVQHVRRKIAEERLTNVDVTLANAVETGLPDEGVDAAFLFGVIHAFRRVNTVLLEMHRVLKKNGILSIQSRWPEKKLLEIVGEGGLFNLRQRAKGVYIFEKGTMSS